MDEGDCCFICLSDAANDAALGPLGRHCGCKAMFSHRSCLTRWQLQNAGKAEEKQCRFCKQTLGDWRTALTEVPTNLKRSPPIMAVVFQGKTVKVPVVTGPEGVAEFKRTVCKLFNLPEGTDFEVTFECKSPVFGDKLHLKGFDCFEAASYCAAVSAAKRANHKAAKQQASSSFSASSSSGAAAAATSSSSAASSSSPAAPAGALAPAAASTTTTLPALRGIRSTSAAAASPQTAGSSSSSSASQPLQQSRSSDALASPGRLMRRLNESLHLQGDRLRRRAPNAPAASSPASGSNLRHASTPNNNNNAPATPGSSSPHPELADGSSSSGALTPLDSGASTPLTTSGMAPSPPAHHHHHKGHGGALSFMRRLRAGILCTGASSLDAQQPAAHQPQHSAASASSSSASSSSHEQGAGVAAAPALLPGLTTTSTSTSAAALAGASATSSSLQPPLAAAAGALHLPRTPSASLPSAAALMASGAHDLIQDPGSPAHSMSAGHHLHLDNPPPAAHVATTTSMSGAAEAKPSGSAFAGSLVSMFRRVF